VHTEMCKTVQSHKSGNVRLEYGGRNFNLMHTLILKIPHYAKY